MKNKIYVAPMAGVTDLAYRKILRETGPCYCYTEMVSAMAISQKNQKTEEYLQTDPIDHPLGVQLFGRDPESFSHAVEILNTSSSFESIDLNLGCPMPKIFNNGDGSALLKEVDTVQRILDAMLEKAKVPISVKMRIGIQRGDRLGFKMARAIKGMGIEHICVHGRTTEQMYQGEADWEEILRIRDEVAPLPVIGNGDIFTAEDALYRLKEFTPDGVMLARGLQGNPFLIAEIEALIRDKSYRISEQVLKETMKRHFEYLYEQKPERAHLEFRKHGSWYLKGFRGSAQLRKAITQIKSKEDLYDLLAIDF